MVEPNPHGQGPSGIRLMPACFARFVSTPLANRLPPACARAARMVPHAEVSERLPVTALRRIRQAPAAAVTAGEPVAFQLGEQARRLVWRPADRPGYLLERAAHLVPPIPPFGPRLFREQRTHRIGARNRARNASRPDHRDSTQPGAVALGRAAVHTPQPGEVADGALRVEHDGDSNTELRLVELVAAEPSEQPMFELRPVPRRLVAKVRHKGAAYTLSASHNDGLSTPRELRSAHLVAFTDRASRG